jgi:hypothetical protein
VSERGRADGGGVRNCRWGEYKKEPVEYIDVLLTWITR